MGTCSTKDATKKDEGKFITYLGNIGASLSTSFNGYWYTHIWTALDQGVYNADVNDLSAGDELIFINDMIVSTKSHQEVINLLTAISLDEPVVMVCAREENDEIIFTSMEGKYMANGTKETDFRFVVLYARKTKVEFGIFRYLKINLTDRRGDGIRNVFRPREVALYMAAKDHAVILQPALEGNKKQPEPVSEDMLFMPHKLSNLWAYEADKFPNWYLINNDPELSLKETVPFKDIETSFKIWKVEK